MTDAGGINVRIIGSVHTVFRAVTQVPDGIERYSLDYTGIELKGPYRKAGAYEMEEVRRRYFDKPVCTRYITISGYGGKVDMSGKPSSGTQACH